MLFNGKYYNKPGHLGMTRTELKEALQGGGKFKKINVFSQNAININPII